MCVVLSSTGSEFHSVGPETAKLLGPMHAVRVRGAARFPCAADRRRWNPLRLMKSHRQGMKEHLHAGICRQEHQVCTGFFDGLDASAVDHADRPKWDRTSETAFSR